MLYYPLFYHHLVPLPPISPNAALPALTLSHIPSAAACCLTSYTGVEAGDAGVMFQTDKMENQGAEYYLQDLE